MKWCKRLPQSSGRLLQIATTWENASNPMQWKFSYMINGAEPHPNGGGSGINRRTVLCLWGCESLPRWWISYSGMTREGRGQGKVTCLGFSGLWPVSLAEVPCEIIIPFDKYFWKCNNLNFPEAWIWICFGHIEWEHYSQKKPSQPSRMCLTSILITYIMNFVE